MKKFYLTICGIMALSLSAMAQPCNGGRYSTMVYTTVTKNAAVTYGANIDYAGNATTLTFDEYEPAGDTAKARPLIIWAHGGSFISGTSADADVSTLSSDFAKRGFVCASINYRLGMAGVDSTNAISAVVRGVQDMKAAIRFFYKDRKNGNVYKIDTNHIYIGGASAGAIAALHVAYLKRDCQIVDPGYLTEAALDTLGGLEGTSGNAGYSDKIAACISLCGALGHYTWMEAGDVPLCSMHGTSDAVVAYGRGEVTPFPGVSLMYLDGDRMLYAQSKLISVTDSFYTWLGAPHVPFDQSGATGVAYMDTTENFVRDFLVGQLGCNAVTPLQVSNAPYGTATLYPFPNCFTGVQNINAGNLVTNLFPNPSNNMVTLTLADGHGQYTIQLTDISGRVISTNTTAKTTFTIEKAGLTAGVYFVKVTDTKGISSVKKLIFY